MAREKEKESGSGEGGTPAWLITFSDMMTLLLTFFVLLLSMATLRDERKKHLALGSISQSFGLGKETMSLLGANKNLSLVEPGPFSAKTHDLSPIKPLLWEDQGKDLDFISNAYVQIVSIREGVLFAPGQGTLTPKGEQILNLILPILKRIEYPVTINGHTSLLRDEYADNYLAIKNRQAVDPSWPLSLQRTLNVYTYLINHGVNPALVKMEAFGRFHPRFSNITRKGRAKNRRVEIVLDKRFVLKHNPNQLKQFFQTQEKEQEINYKGFIFKIPTKTNP